MRFADNLEEITGRPPTRVERIARCNDCGTDYTPGDRFPFCPHECTGYQLSDGTDISRMTVAQIEEHQRRLAPWTDAARRLDPGTDYRGAATGRISPCFPSADEAHERLLKHREQLVARTFLALLIGVAPLLGFLGYGMPAVVVSVVGALGFIATCFYAGGRQTNRMQRRS
jgi:hypothetical protein